MTHAAVECVCVRRRRAASVGDPEERPQALVRGDGAESRVKFERWSYCFTKPPKTNEDDTTNKEGTIKTKDETGSFG